MFCMCVISSHHSGTHTPVPQTGTQPTRKDQDKQAVWFTDAVLQSGQMFCNNLHISVQVYS